MVSAFAVDKNVVSDGVMIAGQDMGGKTRDEVIAYLSGLENPFASSSVTVKMNDSGQTLTVTQESADLKIDVEKTADAAVSYSKGNLFTALAAKFSKERHQLYPRVRPQQARRRAQQLCQRGWRHARAARGGNQRD